MNWTDAEIADLTARYAAGESYGAIAKALGRARNAIAGKIARLGLANPSAKRRRKAPKIRARRLRKAQRAAPPDSVIADLGKAEAAPERFTPVTGAVAAVDALHADQCRWAEGDPKEPGFRFCVRARLGRFPYCADDLLRAMRPAGEIEP